MSTDTDEGLVFTRRQLYERVWNTPMSRLGPELGLSDVGLRKLCERLDIPTPPVGYWAKKQHGKSPRRPRLPATPDPDEPAVTFFPPVGGQDKAIGPEIPSGPEVQVADVLRDPHPAVEATLRSLHAARPDKDGLVQPGTKRCLNVGVKPAHIDRAMRIMDALLKALEARGLDVSLTDRDGQSVTEVVVLDERIGICLHQDTQREERAATPAEADDMRFFGRKDKKFYHRVPTDSLCLLVMWGPSTGTRHRFADTRTRRIENLLDSAIRALYRTAHEMKVDRVRQEELRREREIAAQRQREWEVIDEKAKWSSCWSR